MLLDPETARQRLSSWKNLALAAEQGFTKAEHEVRVMPGNGKPEILTVEDSTIIATLARAGGNGQEIGDAFGVSRDAVMTIKNDGTAKVDEARVATLLERATDIALDRLMDSMSFISHEKLTKLGAKDLSAVASNMSKVHSNLKGDKSANQGPLVNIHIFSPPIKQVTSFKSIDV